ncbi:MAG: hypothetical protein KJO06_12785, partial [Gemmatimonadetes bacterium]|nr:hypothetical protein [Gemmatimonadota bacterium]
MSETADGYRLLARLRGLERQLRRLRDDWRSFRDDPSPETLSDIRLRTRRFSEALEVLAADADPRQPSDPATKWETADDSPPRG